jgi:radical SAM protein with 4Fe4S-binding SPASM domain
MTQDSPDDVARREALWQRHLDSYKKLIAEHPLRYLFLEVTRRCNLACAYCGSSCLPNATRDEMSIGQWIDCLRQIAADFDASKIMVAVTGGEPLLKEHVDDLFAELHRLGFHYGMVTNGFFLDEQRARGMIDAGIGSISISMDAPGEVNDRLRGKGASQKVAQAVAALQQVGFKGKLEIISTITKPAVPLLPKMRQQVASMRVPYWRVAPVMPIGRASKRADLVPGPSDVRAILEFVREGRRDGFAPAPEFSEEGFVGNRFEGCVRPYLAQCRAGITIGGILSDGRIGACPELGDAFVQGDIRTERFKDVWETRYQLLRDRSWTKKGMCAECAQYDRCQGGSMHLYPTPEEDIIRCLYWMAKQTE